MCFPRRIIGKATCLYKNVNLRKLAERVPEQDTDTNISLWVSLCTEATAK